MTKRYRVTFMTFHRRAGNGKMEQPLRVYRCRWKWLAFLLVKVRGPWQHGCWDIIDSETGDVIYTIEYKP